jgi:hypothetical protein
LNSEKIGTIWKKGKLNSEKIWLHVFQTFQIISHFNLLFFHIFYTISQFFSVFLIFFHYSTCLSSIFFMENTKTM